jgi:hypothetical protein
LRHAVDGGEELDVVQPPAFALLGLNEYHVHFSGSQAGATVLDAVMTENKTRQDTRRELRARDE